LTLRSSFVDLGSTAFDISLLNSPSPELLCAVTEICPFDAAEEVASFLNLLLDVVAGMGDGGSQKGQP